MMPIALEDLSGCNILNFSMLKIPATSEPLDFKLFWGRMFSDPPTNSHLWREFSAPRPQ